MDLFDRLKAAHPQAWAAVIGSSLRLAGLGDGTLPEAAFSDYLVQDWLF